MTLAVTVCVQVPLLPGTAVGILTLVVIRARGHRLSRGHLSPGQLRGVARRFLEAGRRDARD